MNAIDKVSDITAADVAEYLRIADLTEGVTAELNNYINVAKSFIMSYTGYPAEDLDNFPDFVIVVMVLCQDMYDNRSLYHEGKGVRINLNYLVETILGMHQVNLL